MRDIKVLKVYNLVDSKGNKLQLRLGILRQRIGEVCISNADSGHRWSFMGKNIPMPVRSGYWFNGFADEIMLDWLKGNGWYPRSCVSMDDGKCHVYELPKAEECSKGNEVYELPNYVVNAGERVLKDAIRWICSNGSKLDAVALYRYVHPCPLYAANDAVNAIRLDSQH